MKDRSANVISHARSLTTWSLGKDVHFVELVSNRRAPAFILLRFPVPEASPKWIRPLSFWPVFWPLEKIDLLSLRRTRCFEVLSR